MERKALALCSVVGLLGLLSAATGFGAEATRIKGSEVQFTSATQCTYPRSPALGLGLIAAVTLTIAQVIINVATGCICCKRSQLSSNSNWTIAFVCFVVSWFTFVVAFLLLLTGAALNDQHGEESMYFGDRYCYVVKPGVTLGTLYYLTLISAKNSNDPWQNRPVSNLSGIVMGQPQFAPQRSREPVFVHEDTYVRRQFT
ncbi:protein MODIFYING WALL LIGNIN [Salix suchowensis]|nr:protein MODIFYING WALL LIGNIN [Salix suchowensis]